MLLLLRSHPYCKKIVILVLVYIASSLLSSFYWNIGILHPTKVLAMRVVVQRVKSASVTLVSDHDHGEIISQIGMGLVALVGIHVDDTIDDVNDCCQRLIHCKLWNNDNTGKPWKYSVKQKQYECLLVSQFTLYGTLSKKSYQPDYKLAMKSESARVLYEQFVQTMRNLYHNDNNDNNHNHPTNNNKIHDGRFGAMMDVSLINDGPVTIIIESRRSSTSSMEATGDKNNNNNGGNDDDSNNADDPRQF